MKLVEVDDLRAEYGNRIILDGVRMDVTGGEIMVIAGASGCGKTTLLKQIIGLLKPAAGVVRLFGESILNLDEKEFNTLQKKTGMLFQNGALLGSSTVGENVAIPLFQHTGLPDRIVWRIVRKKLEMVGLSDSIHRLPTELSGGMRKRAALARAIAMDPPLLLADEPSAGLDPVMMKSLDQLLLKLRDTLGMTMVIVTHETSSIRRIADRITFLSGGKVIFTGSLEEGLKTEIPELANFFKLNS